MRIISNYTIYLSGGMVGLEEESQTKWRNKVKGRLENCECKYQVTCISPVDYYSYNRPYEYDSDREVMEFELHMVRKSDLLMVNFNKPESLGTMAEVAVAYEKRIPIIGINEGGYVLRPWQRDMCDKIFKNINTALNYIENFYLY